MKLLVCTTGTHGDVQPCVAVARGLQEAGHSVEVASVAAFAGLIQDAGLPFVPLWEPDPRKVMRDVQVGTLGHSARVRLHKHLFRRRPPPAAALERQVDLCRGRDLVLSHIPNYLHATEATGVPFAFLAAYPTLPSRRFPHHLSRLTRSLGGPANWLTHLAFRQLFWVPDRHWVNAWRKSLGLSPLGWGGPHPHACRRGVPYWFGYSPSLLPRPDDWPQSADVTGFWYLDTASRYTPDPALEAFLRAGPPPVVMAFGSIVDPAPEELKQILSAALAETGQRGIVLSGWGKDGDRWPASVFQAGWVPLPWLLPRVRAIIHHSGAGTSSEAIRAGIPSVPVPYSGEQKFWAQRLYQQGVASRPIPRQQLTADRLAQAVRSILQSNTMTEQLAALSRRIQAENGVSRVVENVERYLNALRLKGGTPPSPG